MQKVVLHLHKIVHKNLEEGNRSTNNKGGFKKRESRKKDNRICDHCEVPGHIRETCFKQNGYPDWYVELLKTKKKKSQAKKVNMAEASVEVEKSAENKQQEWIAEFIKQEMTKFMKGKQGTNDNVVNFAQTGYFSRLAIKLEYVHEDYWIMDSGASNHICANPRLFTNLACIAYCYCYSSS